MDQEKAFVTMPMRHGCHTFSSVLEANAEDVKSFRSYRLSANPVSLQNPCDARRSGLGQAEVHHFTR